MSEESVINRETNGKEMNKKEIEKIRKHAEYLSKRLYFIRFYNGREIRKVFKNEIVPLLQKEDVNYSLHFVTGEEGLMTLVHLGIQYGFKFRRIGEGAEYDMLPEIARLINNRYQGYKYFLQQYNNWSGEDLERIDERNYATGIDEIEIFLYKSHLDPSFEDRVIEVRFIDYVDYESLL